MITKEEYLQQLKKKEFQMNIFHSYYNQFNIKEEMKFTLEQFSQLFQQFISLYGISQIVLKIRNYFDKEFNIVTILDKNNQEIYWY